MTSTLTLRQTLKLVRNQYKAAQKAGATHGDWTDKVADAALAEHGLTLVRARAADGGILCGVWKVVAETQQGERRVSYAI